MAIFTMNKTEQPGVTGSSVASTLPMILIALAAFVGNGLVLVSVACTRSLRRVPGNAFVVNLAISDILAALLVLPVALVTVMYKGHWIFSPSLCQLEAFLIVLFSNVTFLTLVTFSIYRYLLITSKLTNSQVFLRKRIYYILLTIWVVSGAFSFPPLVGWGKFALLQHYKMCSLDWRIDRSYGIVLIVVLFFIPQCLMVRSYWGIFKFIKAHNQQFFRSFNFRSKKVSPALSPQKEGVETQLGNTNVNPPYTLDMEDSSFSQYHSFSYADVQMTGCVHWEQRGKEREKKSEENDECSKTLRIQVVESQDDVKPKTHGLDEFDKIENGIEINKVKNTTERTPIGYFNLPKTDLPRTFQKKTLGRNNSKNMKRLYRQTKLVRVLLVTVVTFYVCWLPFATDSLLQVLGYSKRRPQHFQMISFWMASTNAVCNPIIYVLLNNQFRTAICTTVRSFCFCIRKSTSN